VQQRDPSSGAHIFCLQGDTDVRSPGMDPLDHGRVGLTFNKLSLCDAHHRPTAPWNPSYNGTGSRRG